MGQLEDPEQESEVLEEATEFLIQQAIRVGDDEDDFEDALDPLQPTGATGSEVAAAFPSDKQEGLALNVEESRESHGSSAAPAAAARAHEDNSARLGDSMRDPEREPNLEYEGLEGEGSGEEGELSEELMAEMALATAQQSSAWGRIIRPPRKKGRHVIVDLCAPIAVLPQHRQAELAASRQAAQASPLPKGESPVINQSFVTLAATAIPRIYDINCFCRIDMSTMLSLCHVIATTCLVISTGLSIDRGLS